MQQTITGYILVISLTAILTTMVDHRHGVVGRCDSGTAEIPALTWHAIGPIGEWSHFQKSEP